MTYSATLTITSLQAPDSGSFHNSIMTGDRFIIRFSVDDSAPMRLQPAGTSLAAFSGSAVTDVSLMRVPENTGAWYSGGGGSLEGHYLQTWNTAEPMSPPVDALDFGLRADGFPLAGDFPLDVLRLQFQNTGENLLADSPSFGQTLADVAGGRLDLTLFTGPAFATFAFVSMYSASADPLVVPVANATVTDLVAVPIPIVAVLFPSGLLLGFIWIRR